MKEKCRPGCGACCVAISISSPLPGMPEGKLAGVLCLHLSQDYACTIFAHPDRPKVCASLKPLKEMCQETREQALTYLLELEQLTQPENTERKSRL